jgi:uncharacterized DUF497 family protein
MPSVGHVRITGFDRDHGNALNNEKHGVAPAEAEGVFNQPLLMPEDLRHRDRGARFHAPGKHQDRRSPARGSDVEA